MCEARFSIGMAYGLRGMRLEASNSVLGCLHSRDGTSVSCCDVNDSRTSSVGRSRTVMFIVDVSRIYGWQYDGGWVGLRGHV